MDKTNVSEKILSKDLNKEDGIPSKNLTMEERVIWLEKTVELLLTYNTDLNDAYLEVMKVVGKIIDKDKSDKDLLNKWTDSVEKRFRSMNHNLQNMNFIFNTLYPITPEQMEILEIKKNEILKKVVSKKED